jgi:hypothetical protein
MTKYTVPVAWFSRGQRIAPSLAPVMVLTLSLALEAMYVRPDLENVPVDRLIQNLDQLARSRPKDTQTRLNLARVHAMAYAQKTDTVPVWKGRESEGAWFGFEPSNVPFVARSTDDAAKLKAAKAHLAKAIDLYAEVIKVSPNDLVARLGHAWCIDQSGDKQKAAALYREVINAAWPKEQSTRSGSLGWVSITAEAAGYLLPMLDPVKDKAEVATLRERVAQMERVGRPITPVVIALRDGMSVFDLVDWSVHVPFDADGSGVKRRWTWVSKDAGWLVYDPHATKVISSGLQLFGNVSFWLFWANGYEAMAALDDNHDGRLTGSELTGLAIWRDLNGNGIAEPGEVLSLTEWGISELSCAYEWDDSDVEVAFSRTGVTFANGATGPTYDVLLHRQ